MTTHCTICGGGPTAITMCPCGCGTPRFTGCDCFFQKYPTPYFGRGEYITVYCPLPKGGSYVAINPIATIKG